MRHSFLLAFVALAIPVPAAERAAYDSNGRIIALLSDAEDLELSTHIVALQPSGKRVPLQVRRAGAGARRQGQDLAWSSPFQLPDGGRGRLEWKSEESPEGVRYSGTISAETALDVDAIEFVADLPRPLFLNGRVSANRGAPVALAPTRSLSPILLQTETAALRFEDAPANVVLELSTPAALPVAVADRWDNLGRSFQVRAALVRGGMKPESAANFDLTLRLTRKPVETPPVHVRLDPSKTLFRFDGFGGNYCWNNQSPIADYTLKNLKIAWARTEMKVVQWDKQRDAPGPELRADFERMRGFQQMGIPYVISIWWLPERFYTDPYEKPRSAHFRLVNPEKWDELLELIGSYLQYARRAYGVEPDLFSFNEANIGVYVGLTPTTHTEAIKRIGTYFRRLGLKTKMLLGDATGPRDTHKFVLEAASDPGAMQFIGAVAFHSWGGGAPEQYRAWGDVAEWLRLPLLVTELGVDAAAYYTRSWDSYQYGLREARMTQELLTYARPQGTQYWQFTNDYALARLKDGVVEPTARLFLMKHFTDLTPPASDALAVSSDQPSVLVTAFRKGGDYAIHILNLGAARTALLEGLPNAAWRSTETTEAAHYQRKPPLHSAAAPLSIPLPARSMVTLTGAAPPQSAAKGIQQ
jgi:hypothetical protein